MELKARGDREAYKHGARERIFRPGSVSQGRRTSEHHEENGQAQNDQEYLNPSRSKTGGAVRHASAQDVVS